MSEFAKLAPQPTTAPSKTQAPSPAPQPKPKSPSKTNPRLGKVAGTSWQRREQGEDEDRDVVDGWSREHDES